MKLFNHLILYHPLLLLSSFFPSIRVFSIEMALCIRWPKYWSLSSFFPSIRVFSNEMALCIRWPKYWSFSTILPVNIQGWFPLGLTGLISLLFKGLSRVFSRPQFKIISSLALSLLHAPTLTWIHDYGKNQSFDYMGLCQQCNVCFLIHYLALCHLFYQGASVI